MIENTPLFEDDPSIMVFAALVCPEIVISLLLIAICELTINVPSHKMMVSPSAEAPSAVAIDDPPIYPGSEHEVPAPAVPVAATYLVVGTACATEIDRLEVRRQAKRIPTFRYAFTSKS